MTGGGLGLGGGMGAGMGGGSTPSMVGGGAVPAAGAAQGSPGELPPDLACTAGPRAAGWAGAKRSFRALLSGAAGSPLTLASQEARAAALDEALRELKAAEALSPAGADDCGLGKLCLQLLSMANIDDPAVLAQLFTGLEQLASPVLTMLLDVPWVVTGQSGWPIFGLLSQINLRKQQVPGALNGEEVDGLNEPAGQQLLVDLAGALQSGEPAHLAGAGGSYLQKETRGSALAPLTAIAAQAYSSQDPQQRAAILQSLQQGFQQVMSTAPELDIALSTNWPLWGLVHLAVDGYSSAP